MAFTKSFFEFCLSLQSFLFEIGMVKIGQVTSRSLWTILALIGGFKFSSNQKCFRQSLFRS